VAGCYEHGNEPSGSLKGGEFIDYLSESWLLEDIAPCNWLVGSLV
jgi:hypothetical protein